MINGINDVVILVARLLLATLFLIFGWRKLRDYSGTVSQMMRLSAPVPVLAPMPKDASCVIIFTNIFRYGPSSAATCSPP